MRIVNRQTFLALPAGTVYAKYAPCWLESLHIKGESIQHSGTGEWIDFYHQDLETFHTPKDLHPQSIWKKSECWSWNLSGSNLSQS